MYKYELHCHTKQSSRCSVIDAKEMVNFYKDNGYSGITVTDHFNGGSAMHENLCWKERVKRFSRGFEEALNEGARQNINVFFGLEYSFFGNDFLFLGLDISWFQQQDDVPDLAPIELFDKIHSGGGFIIHAHPFRLAPWSQGIYLFPKKIDAVEIYNGGLDKTQNDRALWYSKAYNIARTAGSDTHSKDVKNLCGVKTYKPVESLNNLIELIKSNRARPFIKK